MATSAELLDLNAPGQLDSVSFLPTLLGQPEKQFKREFLYWEFLERRGAQAVVIGETGRWKAMRKQSATAPIELYDLDNDLGETTNVAADHPKIIARAEELFKEQHVPNPLWKAPFQPRRK